VKVKVLSADILSKRIALSMKALMVSTGRAMEVASKRNSSVPPSKPRPKPQPRPTLSLDEKLASLSTRWKTT
jgi:uncharacterized protein